MLKETGNFQGESYMHRLLFVASDKDTLSDLASALVAQDDVELSWADSGSMALEMVSNTPVDLMVTDENLADMAGLELANKLLHVNPMINCAAVSALTPEDFHEASEGLGLLGQLPPQPGGEEAENLLQRLRELKNISF
jgi:response regulator RpfG family c-di-GMP phosphodiesterase